MTLSILKDGIAQAYHGEPLVLPNGGRAYVVREDGALDFCPIPEGNSFPALARGEGFLYHTDNFEIRPLEAGIDFLKADSAAAWLEFMTLRHLERVRSLDRTLLVLVIQGEKQ